MCRKWLEGGPEGRGSFLKVGWDVEERWGGEEGWDGEEGGLAEGGGSSLLVQVHHLYAPY